MNNNSSIFINIRILVLPPSVQSVIRTAAFDSSNELPTLQNIIANLRANGIEAEGEVIEVKHVFSLVFDLICSSLEPRQRFGSGKEISQ